MAQIEFSREEKEQLVAKVKRYFEDQLDLEIGGFDAEFLIDFFAEEMGGAFYNKGLHDARAIVSAKVEEIDDAIYEIEKPMG